MAVVLSIQVSHGRAVFQSGDGIPDKRDVGGTVILLCTVSLLFCCFSTTFLLDYQTVV